MKLQLYKVNNRYAFAIGKFSSLSHFYLCPDIKPSYQYAWQAYRDAKRLHKYQFAHIDAIQRLSADDLSISDVAVSSEISAEDMLMGHYSKIFEMMANRTKSFKNEKDKEIAYGEVKAIVSGILKVKENLDKDSDRKKIESVLSDFRKLVQEKFPKLLAKDKAEMEKKKEEPPPAPPTPAEDPNAATSAQPPVEAPEGQLPMMPTAQVDAIMKYAASNTVDDVRDEVLDEYSERVCEAIEKLHPDAICKIDYDNGTFKITKASGEPLLRVFVNSDLNIEDIEPDSELSRAIPLHSIEFYQKYWKPIVEKVGHCLIKGLNILLCPAKSSLPDIPKDIPHKTELRGWNVKDSSEQSFELHFAEGDNPTWKFKPSDMVKEATRKIRPSKYTEEDFIKGQPRRVKCIDPNLKSVLGKIGEVVQIIPLQDHIELDVDFGRLVVRLTEHQIELMDEIPTNI